MHKNIIFYSIFILKTLKNACFLIKKMAFYVISIISGSHRIFMCNYKLMAKRFLHFVWQGAYIINRAGAEYFKNFYNFATKILSIMSGEFM